MKKIFGILAISALVFASCGQKTTDEAVNEETATPEEVVVNDVQEAAEEAAATIDSAVTEAVQEVADAAAEANVAE